MGRSDRAPAGAAAIQAVIVAEQLVVAVVVCRAYSIYRRRGVKGVFGAAMEALRSVPLVQQICDNMLDEKARKAVRILYKPVQNGSLNGSAAAAVMELRRPVLQLPPEGMGADVLNLLETYREMDRQSDPSAQMCYTDKGPLVEHCRTLLQVMQDVQDELGVFDEGGHAQLVRAALSSYIHESDLNPLIFPSLRKLECEVISMTTSLFNGDSNTVGSLTSGSTESILLAVKTYRDYARKVRPGTEEPFEMVVPITAHPAFRKAADYFGVKAVFVPVGADKRVDVEAVKLAVGSRTILLVASAPQHCHGVIDPIPELAVLASSYGLPLHVDGSCDAFMLPWLEKLGHNITEWDFRSEGVTSISADLRKYGYTLQDTGVLLWRNTELRASQFFADAEWPGGLYASPSLTGVRSGGNIAAAWAAMMSMGESGYLEQARYAAQATKQIKKGIADIESIGLVAESQTTLVAICSTEPDGVLDIYVVGDLMEEKGWRMERQHSPASLHLSVTPHHISQCDKLLSDLEDCVHEARLKKPTTLNITKVTAPVYRLLWGLPDRGIITQFLLKLTGEVYRMKPAMLRGGDEEGEEDSPWDTLHDDDVKVYDGKNITQ